MRHHLNTFAAFILIVIAGTVRVRASAYVYDLYAQNPDALPGAPQFIQTGPAGGDTNDTADVATPNTLTLTSGDGVGYRWNNNTSIGAYDGTGELNIHARLRVLTSTSRDVSVFRADFIGGGHRFGIGASLDAGSAVFFLINSAGDRWSTRITVAAPPVASDGFYDVFFHKDADTNANTADDPLVLKVDNVAYVTNVTTWGALGAGTVSTDLLFGQAESVASVNPGSMQLTGLSFGIGQAAPGLIPEPTTALTLLPMIGAGFLRRHARCA
jgi:hypothetical protein